MNNERVAKLEKQISTQRIMNWLLGIVIIGGIGLGFAKPQIEHLVLRSVTIVDENNMPRIELATNGETGELQAFIKHFDAQGKTRLWQGTEGEVVSATYYDKEGQMRQSNGVRSDIKGTWYSFFDDRDEVVAEMSWVYENDVAPQIVLGHGKIIGAEKILLFDKEMNVRIALDASDYDDDSSLTFVDNDGVGRLSLGLNANDACGMSLFDEEYALRWRVSVQNQNCAMELRDTNGVERISSAVLESNGAFFSINGEDDTFDILMGSVADEVLFQVDGIEDGSLHTKVPVQTADEEIHYEK